MKPVNTVPVFALAVESTWDDLENAMEACVAHHSRVHGRILPVMLFAPMTNPENPDTWEPMKLLPENLLIVSTERAIDKRILAVLQQAKATCGEVYHAGVFPLLVSIDFKRPLADVYEQMTRARIHAYADTSSGQNDPSFFFLRSGAVVEAFSTELPRTPH